MLAVVKEEAERAGIEMSEFDISEITKLVDVNLITKIEGYKQVNQALEQDVDVKALARMKSVDLSLRSGFKKLVKKNLDASMIKEIEAA